MSGNVKIFLNFLVLCIATVGSCTARKDQSEFEVIERSKAEPPLWTESKLFKLKDAGEQLSFVTLKSDIENLSAGIKESQKLALEDSREAMLEEIRARVAAIATNANIAVSKPNELDELLADGVYQSYKKQAMIGDIYYQKVRNNNPALKQPSEYFQVFIRVDWDKSYIVALMEGIAQKLQKASDKGLKSLGLAMKTSNSSAPIGH